MLAGAKPNGYFYHSTETPDGGPVLGEHNDNASPGATDDGYFGSNPGGRPAR